MIDAKFCAVQYDDKSNSPLTYRNLKTPIKQDEITTGRDEDFVYEIVGQKASASQHFLGIALREFIHSDGGRVLL